MIKYFLSLIILMGPTSSYCVGLENVLAFKPEYQRGDLYEPRGLWPLLGVGMGTMDGNTSTRTGGVPSHIKLLGSYYFDKYPIVTDAGVGMHNQFLTQKGSDSDTIQSLYTELAGRYQFTNGWQLGAIWNTLVDNPDRYRSNTENLASFMGAQALREFTWQDEYIVRLGGRAMTSIGLSGGSVNTLMAELEVSFGPGYPARVGQIESPAPRAVAPHLAKQAIRSYNLNPKLVHFGSDSVQLVKSSDLYFDQLANALVKNQGLFESVQVIGHADQRGGEVYNSQLSYKRASAVMNKLIAAGMKSSHVLAVGRGKHDLLTDAHSPKALELNRRVELRFLGVKDQAALHSVLDSLNR